MRSSYAPVMAVVPEGWALLIGTIVVGEFFYRVGHPLPAILAALLLPVIVVYFYEPGRTVPSKPRGILAPVDGVVVFRRECFDPVLEREAIRLLVRVDWWGAYCFRAPLEGEVVAVPGRPNRRLSLIRTDEGDDVIIRPTRGWMFGARPVWLPFGERVGQGRRCGVRRLVREVEVLLPASARIEVELGEHVRAGETLLATILRRNA